MGIIERSLTIIGQKNKRVKVFFDSGSSFSLVNPSIVSQVGYLKKWNVNTKVELGNGEFMVFKVAVLLGVCMNKRTYFHKFLVGDIPDNVVIGVDFMQDYGHTLVFKKNDRVVAKNPNLKNHRGKYVL